MSVYKDMEVKPFKLSELIPKEGNDAATEFKLNSLKDAAGFKQDITPELIRQEREFEGQSAFAIDSLVREHRGILEQENSDLEVRISEEVEKRIAILQKEAYETGLEQGRTEGVEAANAEAKAVFEEKIDELTNTLATLQDDCRSIYEANQDEVYRMVKNLTKWVVLKEVDEKYYLSRLLEKLILEINAKSNLIIRVNQASFGYMPEIVKIVERKVGTLTNTRIEVDLEMEGRGIILEAENSVVDGSLESQLENIDRLFRNTGI